MELTNEFVIDRDVEETWKILNDLEFIAPCMPGAQLTEVEGDEYRGLVKIKVGPITANYKGKASFVEQDAENRVSRLKAEGRDPRQGNANAMVTARMSEAGENRTNVEIHTELGLSGKIASFGRGAIEDVSKKLLGQFTDNLREKLESGAGASDPEPAASGSASTGAASSESEEPVDPESTGYGAALTGEGPASVEAAPDAEVAPNVRKVDSPEPDAVDLLDVAGGTVAKRAIPAVGVAAIVLAIIYWIIR